jgi:hypothetical protein
VTQPGRDAVPDKAFIGRIERGFDFLGYYFGPEGLTVAARNVETFVARPTRSSQTQALVGPISLFAKQAPSLLELLLVDLAARKSLLKNIEWRLPRRYECKMTRATEPTDGENHQNDHDTDEDDPHEGAKEDVAPARVVVPSMRGSRCEDHREQNNRACNVLSYDTLLLGLVSATFSNIYC